MNIRKVTVSGLAFVLGSFTLFIACEETVGSGEEMYDLYQGLERVEGTTSITINQGEAVGRDAWFEFEINSVENDTIIAPGTYDGWCIEWTKPIAQQGDLHENLQIYSTFGEDRWKPLNHFLNIKDHLKKEDPELSFREFQAIIWAVTEGPEFDLDKLTDDEIPSRLMKDGEPRFNKEKVQEIASYIKADAPSFEYSPNTTYALFLKTGDSEQDVMISSDPPVETVSHGYVEGVTPDNIDPGTAERTYPVIQADWDGPGGDKRWLGWNLGATGEPASVSDDSPESAGWYFQFNHRQGIYPDVPNDEKVLQHNPGPVTGPQDPELDSDWINTDPCSELLDDGWRIPTEEEWQAVADANASSRLNLHYSGYILGNLSFLSDLGSQGYFWSSTQHMGANRGVSALFDSNGLSVGTASLMWDGMPLRCIED